MELTADRLREVLHYEPSTGVFTRRTFSAPNATAGMVAGCARTKRRCVEIRVDGKLYKAHRLAWLYMTGAWPQNVIDHINGDPYCNRFLNLRDVTNMVNVQNVKRAAITNSTGVLGVTRLRSSGKFKAQISIDGITKNLGHFASAEQAHAVYIAAKRKHHEGNTL